MRSGRVLARTAATVAGTVAGTRLGLALARTTGHIGPVEVEIAARFSPRGGTDVDAGLLGTAHLATHRGPLAADVRAGAFDRDVLSALPALDRDTAVRDATQLARSAAVRSAAGALVGAALASAVATRRASGALVGAGLAAAGLAAAGAAAALTRDPGAWRDPELAGLLAEAPKILGDLRAAPERIDTYRAQLAELVQTGTDVYTRVTDLPGAPPDDAIRLVHVSDLHLNPMALPLTKVLVDRYRADAVVDTGDLVDWGTPAEDRFADDIATLGVPYVFVKGNHDSDGTVAAVARQPNAVVLDADSDPVTVAGLVLAGMADPRHTADKTTGDDRAEYRVSDAARAFAQRLDGRTIDAVLVHDPAAARQLAGLTPLVLAGHTHERALREVDGTTVVVQGSSGGSGLRGVQADPPTELSFSVLHLDRATRRLVVIDEITFDGIGRTGVRVERRNVAPEVVG